MKQLSLWLGMLAALCGAGCGAEEPPPVGADRAALWWWESSSYTATRHPIVLIPGFAGFRSLLGMIDYFPGVVRALEDGGARVHVLGASQAESSETRGQQLVLQLDELRARTGAARFNLIGHSQGGLDARYIAAVRPDLVASVTSVSSPHLGTPVADAYLGAPLEVGQATVQGLADFFKLLAGSDQPNDARACLTALSTAGAAAFNAKYPAAVPRTPCGPAEPVVGGIPYYSWGGVGWLTNPLDLLDGVWLIHGLSIPEANDGLVGRCSTHLGRVIRDDYTQNHIDSANMVFGLVSPFHASPKSLYRAHANRLKNAGL